MIYFEQQDGVIWRIDRFSHTINSESPILQVWGEDLHKNEKFTFFEIKQQYPIIKYFYILRVE